MTSDLVILLLPRSGIFPIDTLKVDRSLIGNIPTNKIDMAITQAIIDIGKAMQLTIVAEGVETPAQLSF